MPVTATLWLLVFGHHGIWIVHIPISARGEKGAALFCGDVASTVYYVKIKAAATTDDLESVLRPLCQAFVDVRGWRERDC